MWENLKFIYMFFFFFFLHLKLTDIKELGTCIILVKLWIIINSIIKYHVFINLKYQEDLF